jgi:NAD+ kinase
MGHSVIGLAANISKPNAADLTRQLVAQFRSGGAVLLCEEETAKHAGLESGLPLTEVTREAELLVVLGGDGTILHTARRLGPALKPLAAVNTGRLGFLTTATAEETGDFVSAVLSRQFHISQRRTVEATFTGVDGRTQTLTGLNEAVVSRGSAARMIRLNVTINGAFVNCYSGDGLIVSTPTGSTAYSLSAGGPIVCPAAGVFCITPICPHVIAYRSVVVNDDVEIVLEAVAASEELLFSMDGGEPVALDWQRPISIRRGAWDVPLVTLPDTTFFGVLRHKLQWNGSSV